MAEQVAIGPGCALQGVVQEEVKSFEVWGLAEEQGDSGEVLVCPRPRLACRYPDGAEMLHGAITGENNIICLRDDSDS